MTLADVEQLKLTISIKGWSKFDLLCEEVKKENKHFSKKEIEESALKIMRNDKNKKIYFN